MGASEPPWERQPHRTEGKAPQPASSKEPERPHFTRRFATLRIDLEGCFPELVWPPGVIIHRTLAASRLRAKPSPPSPPLASGTSIATEMGGQLGQEAGSRKYPHPPPRRGSGCQRPTHPPSPHPSLHQLSQDIGRRRGQGRVEWSGPPRNEPQSRASRTLREREAPCTMPARFSQIILCGVGQPGNYSTSIISPKFTTADEEDNVGCEGEAV